MAQVVPSSGGAAVKKLEDDDAELPAQDTSTTAKLMVLVGLTCYASGITVLYSFGVYVVPLTDTYENGRADVSWIGSIHYFSAYAAGSIVGLLVQKIGLKLSAVMGGFFLIGGSVLASYAPHFAVLHIAFGLMNGFGVACATLTSISMVITWFDKRRGLATGIVAAGSGIGNFIGPLIAQQIMDQDCCGWAESIRYIGICSGGLVIISGTMMKFRTVSTPKAGVIKTGLSKKYFRFFLLFCFIGAFSFNIPIIHLPASAEDVGISEDTSALLLSIMGVAQIFGRPSYGLLADIFGPARCLLVAVLLMSVMAILWTTVMNNFATLLVFSIVYGFNVGAVYSLPPAIIGQYFKGINPAPLLGVYFTVGSGSVVFGPVLAGLVFDLTGTYFYAGLLCGIPLAVASFMLMKMVHIRSQEKKEAAEAQDRKQLLDPTSDHAIVVDK